MAAGAKTRETSVRASILVCDDDDTQRKAVASYLRRQGYAAAEASDGQDALEQIERVMPDLVITDMHMPRLDGLDLLRRLRVSAPELPVIVLSANASIEMTLEATDLGARDYLTKPFDLRELGIVVGGALDACRLENEVRFLRKEKARSYGKLIGSSPIMERLYGTLARLEDIATPTVLITGESGTGKDLIAHAIHARGPRKGGPMIAVDCASLPETLVESELFGHERGAFTDARSAKQGLFELARGGTLFLDEIGELPMSMQARLLRALENRTFRRVGGVADLKVDSGIIAATNRDLSAEVKRGRFREDLYFRLNVMKVEAPPLRARREDVPILIQHFIDRYNQEFGRSVKGVAPEVLSRLQSYEWPGNVRELRNVIERLVILETGERISLASLPAELRFGKGNVIPTPFVLPQEGVDLVKLEYSLMVQAMERTNGNQSAAARLLGITRFALRYRMEKQGEPLPADGE